MNHNRNFGKLKSETEIEYGPVPLTVVTHHHEEYDVPVFDLETGDIFYHDSDEDFKRVMDSELYASLLKWEEEVRIRWEQFENSIAKLSGLYV